MVNTFEEIIEKGYLTLYTLILNIKGNEKINVINEDDGSYFIGNEEEIEKEKREWLFFIVNNIYCENSQIKVEISKQ